MAEFAAKDVRESIQGRVEHPSGKLEFRAPAAPCLARQLLGVGNRGRQGTPLLHFTEVVGFVEGKQVYAYRSHVSGHGLQQPGGMPGIQ